MVRVGIELATLVLRAPRSELTSQPALVLSMILIVGLFVSDLELYLLLEYSTVGQLFTSLICALITIVNRDTCFMLHNSYFVI